MAAHKITEQQMLDELQDLEPSRWPEVLDFIGFLKEKGGRQRSAPGTRELTARTFLRSGIVGLWEDRQDIGDRLGFAR